MWNYFAYVCYNTQINPLLLFKWNYQMKYLDRNMNFIDCISTNSMNQSPPWYTNSRSASQGIYLPLIWNPKFHYCICKSRHWSLSWATLINPKPSYTISLRSFSNLSSRPRLSIRNGLLPSSIQTKILFAFIIFPLFSHPSLFYNHNNSASVPPIKLQYSSITIYKYHSREWR